KRKEFARHNRELYHKYLSWESIKKSLLANGFATERTLQMLDVHYRFLSAFTHPLTDVRALTRGRSHASVDYDHYSSELALLYVIVLAVEELRHFRAAANREPIVALAGWDATEELCTRAWKLSGHLWFPGHDPHPYDRVHEANCRAFRQIREGSPRAAIDP